jgi:hypothetical protein
LHCLYRQCDLSLLTAFDFGLYRSVDVTVPVKHHYDLQEVNELNRKIYELEQRISELEGEKAEHAKRDLQTLIKA